MVFANNAIYCPGTTAVDAQVNGGAAFSSNFVQGRLNGLKIDGFQFCDGGNIHEAFIEPDNDNFWPKPASVLIEKGDSGFAPELDFNHTLRKALFDVGAYESDGNAENPGWHIEMGFKDIR
jgi:hypothetical protein